MVISPQDAHVIIVEDNSNNMLVIMKLLKLIGVEHCHWYPSGRHVVEFVRCMSQADAQRRPDLVLLDIGLPGEDGYAVLSDLRADPNLAGAQIVAVTCRSSTQEMKRAQAAGFDGFIGKPIDPKRFPGQIRRVLAGESVWEL